MKKSLVAVGVIVALGAVWTGASWYTGSKVEAELNKVITNSNAFITANNPSADVVFKLENYKRGVFSSQADIVITSTTSADENIVFNADISHGPLPLSQVAKFNLMPKLGAVNVELANTNATKELFEATKGKPFMHGSAVIGYSKNVDSSIELIPLEYTKDDGKFSFSGAKFDIATGSDLSTIDATLVTDSLVISSTKEEGSITMKGLKLVSNVTKSQHGFYTGTQSFVIADTDVNIPETKFSFKNLDVSSDTSINGDDVKGNISYKISDVKALEQNLGSGELTVAIEKLDAKALGKFVEQYNQALADGLATGNPGEVSEKIAMQMMTTTLPELMKSKPVLTMSPFYWKNDAGQSSIDLSITFNKWNQDEITALAMQNKVDEAFKQLITSFDFSMKLNKPMVIESMTQAMILDGGVAASAEDKKAVQEQVSEEFAGVQQMLTADMFSNPFEEMFMTDEQRAEKAKEKKHPWMIDSENDLTMTVKFSGNDLTFNDDKYTLAEFLIKMKMMPGAEDEMGYEEEAQPADGAEIAEPAIEAEQPAEAPAAQ
ncbi:YdgA family protein [Providencia alcalifaciens]|uniref:YdgA family protein n=1 Tax=Providencia alcalifaciens TaxID=126385 RepID=UPI001CE131C0|nr:YdgA family protein [Providencia alcalifaciens]UBX48626.1 YdgA family protein [Providencia alcalifaciens]